MSVKQIKENEMHSSNIPLYIVLSTYIHVPGYSTVDVSFRLVTEKYTVGRVRTLYQKPISGAFPGLRLIFPGL